MGSQLTVELCRRNDGFFILCKSTGGIFDDIESCRHHFVQGFLIDIKNLFFQFINLIEYLFTLIDGSFFNLCL